ncbi:tRNA nuclease WapA [Geobacter sp. OR-1]|uniref:DUF6531 domain-containing protein n=1 Tax=Geobacter sp. OR-1 TaxID=1266765 RepID=UPI000542497B|nr:DUF6531 domain-containing protein [Geobacter sp. OR-1]GAM11185.1 tRNA nuclease WapA [Geobacter sp. OR-1]
MFKLIHVLAICLLSLLLQLPAAAWGNVSLRNGNFFTSFRDIGSGGGKEPEIERVYNSKSPAYGIFGWGWGSALEVNLGVAADGSLIVNEFGGGAEVHFYPPDEKPELMRQNLLRLVDLKKFSTPAEQDAYRKKLQENIEFRDTEWKHAVSMGLVEPRRLPVGTIFTSNYNGHTYVVKTRDGYLRYLGNGKTEEYDNHGRLRKSSDSNDNYLAYSYDDKGRISRISDNQGRWISLAYNSEGRLVSAADNKGKAAEYRYNKHQQLIYSRDIDGNVYEYDYDRRHNLRSIRYSDGTSVEISYYGMAYNENVRSVKNLDGTLTSYTYDLRDPLRYKVESIITGKENVRLSSASYEYFFEVQDNGIQYTRRLISNIDADITDTEYNDNEQPLKITRNGKEVRFAYDPWGQVTLKETPSTRTEMGYHTTLNKVSWVRVTDRKSGDIEESKFSYDTKGNLVTAHNDDVGQIKLTYDPQGRVATMNSDKGELAISYNENSKPLKISLKGVGDITVTYTADGEIAGVDSPGGEEVALQISATVQQLQKILKPAGISLSF